MYLAIISSVLIGFLAKFTDLIVDDGLNINKYIGYSGSVVYGFLLAFLMYSYPALTPLCLAVSISVIMTGKIDAPTHSLAIASMIFFIAFFGLPQVNFLFLVTFLVAGTIDEIGNDYIDKRKKKRYAKIFFQNRLTLEFTVFIISLITGEWILWISMASFDVAYILTGKIK
ncbi:MAG: hypothetical protein JW716_01650 [Candidatus Aenigmarchaeota archaeon]|nr:hypothetical protein [Candidatus Aenigmarchaeota archaeon]